MKKIIMITIKASFQYIILIYLIISAAFQIYVLLQNRYPEVRLKATRNVELCGKVQYKKGISLIQHAEVDIIKVKADSLTSYLLLNYDNKNVLNGLFRIAFYILTIVYIFNLNASNVYAKAKYNILTYIIAFYLLYLFAGYFGELYTENWFTSHPELGSVYVTTGFNNFNTLEITFTAIILMCLLNFFRALHKQKNTD